MRIETLIIVASEVFSSRAKADRGTHLPSRWFFGLSTNKAQHDVQCCADTDRNYIPDIVVFHCFLSAALQRPS
jgi:hypothetical protein